MNEQDILQIVADNPQISQRKIAQQTGISLGQVNFLIKKCVKKGLIKIEGQSPKSIRYILTPIGMKEKAKLTLEYIKISYKAVMTLTNKIRTITFDQIDEGKTIYVYGSKDEIYELVIITLEEKKAKYSVINSHDMIDLNSDYVIYVWESEYIERIKTLNYINILG